MHQSTPLHPVVGGCIEACQRCQEAARRVAEAGDGAYKIVGPHLRHCLDHVTCLLQGLEQGILDYDARERDAALETDPARFDKAMASAIDRLSALQTDDLTRPVHMKQIPATGAEPVLVSSTVERELLFVSSHAIHHLATIATIAGQHNIALPEYLSVAYSTAAYRASLAEAQS